MQGYGPVLRTRLGHRKKRLEGGAGPDPVVSQSECRLTTQCRPSQMHSHLIALSLMNVPFFSVRTAKVEDRAAIAGIYGQHVANAALLNCEVAELLSADAWS